ncbi:hypothetical protein ACFQ9X_15760 [Catenulispora yoronensis]
MTLIACATTSCSSRAISSRSSLWTRRACSISWFAASWTSRSRSRRSAAA